MAAYVDCFVLSVPKKKLAVYRAQATLANKIWREHGALDYKECLIDDPKPKFVTFSFPKMAKTKPSEHVIMAYIVFKNRAHRDKVNAKVMADPRLNNKDVPMPFDMKRLSYAGFKTIVG